MTTFDSLGLAEPILAALHDVGYENPSPIQEQAIPELLDSRDVIGQAQTGTGKSAAFGIPLIEGIETKKGCRTRRRWFWPRRASWAMQIGEELRRIRPWRYHPRDSDSHDLRRRQLRSSAGRTSRLAPRSWWVRLDAFSTTSAAALAEAGRGQLFDSRRGRPHARYGLPARRRAHPCDGRRAGVRPRCSRPPCPRSFARRGSLYARSRHDPRATPARVTVDEVDQVYYEVADRDKVEGLIPRLLEQVPRSAQCDDLPPPDEDRRRSPGRPNPEAGAA